MTITRAYYKIYKKTKEDETVMFEFIKNKKDTEVSDSPEIAQRLQSEAEELNDNDEPKKALKHCLRAYEIYTALYAEDSEKYKPFIASCCDVLGSIYNKLDKYDESYTYHNIAQEMYTELSAGGNAEYRELLADQYSNIGDTFFFKGDYDTAEENYKKSLEIYIELSESDHAKYAEDVAYCYDCLAKAYSGKEDYTSSIETYEKVIAIYEGLASDKIYDSPDDKEIEYHDNLASAYSDMGYIYSCVKDFEDAEKYYLKAAEIYRVLTRIDAYEYSYELSVQYEDLAALYEDMGKPELVSEYEKKAKKLGV